MTRNTNPEAPQQKDQPADPASLPHYVIGTKLASALEMHHWRKKIKPRFEPIGELVRTYSGKTVRVNSADRDFNREMRSSTWVEVRTEKIH